jgi:hypothetical protein
MKLLQKALSFFHFKKTPGIALPDKNHLTRVANITSIVILAFLLLCFFVKGASGNPIYYQTEHDKGITGPFEGPNSTSRYALTEAFAENNTVLLTREQAIFSLPDVVYYQDKYFTVFMPGISFIGVPFYLLGKNFGLQQLFAYFSVTIFAFLNMFLVARIAYKLGANLYASLLAGFLFLFATNQLSYALFYTQHATSVAFLLCSILIALNKPSVIRNILFGVLAGMSLLLDVPNLILLLPTAVALLISHIHVQKEHAGTKFSFNTKLFAALIGIIPFIVFMAWYNFQTAGSYTKLAQSLGQVEHIDQEVGTVPPDQKTATSDDILPFTPKNQLLGTAVLLFGDERSISFYNPVVLLGVLGIIYLYKKRQKIVAANILAGTVLLNIVLYSMFGDPWGGWSFGARYLIPASAVLCIGIALAIQAYKKKLWFVVLFGITAFYSIFINTVGALTTSLVPTKTDALNETPHLLYNYLYNIQFVNQNKLSSLIYNLLFSNVPSWIFVGVVAAIIMLTTVTLYVFAYKSHDTYKEENT